MMWTETYQSGYSLVASTTKKDWGRVDNSHSQVVYEGTYDGAMQWLSSRGLKPCSSWGRGDPAPHEKVVSAPPDRAPRSLAAIHTQTKEMNMATIYTVTTTWPDGWDSTAQMLVDVVIDRNSEIERSSRDTAGGRDIMVIVDQGGDRSGRSYTRTELAEQLGLCGELTECHLLVSALRQYAVVREALSLGDASEDSEWTPYEPRNLDAARPDDYDLLCTTVGLVYGHQAEIDQRAALQEVLT